MKISRKLPWLTFLFIGTIFAIFATYTPWLLHWATIVSKNFQELIQSPQPNPKDKFDASLRVSQVIVSSLATLATLAGSIFLVLNFKISQKNLENSEKRLEEDIRKNHQESEINRLRLLSDDLSKAVEQLGRKETYAKIGAITTLRRLYDLSDNNRLAIISILRAFIKDTSPFIEKTLQQNNSQELIKSSVRFKEDVKEAIEVLSDILKKVFADKEVEQELHLDFSEINFYEANLEDFPFRNSTILGSNFTNASLVKADLSYVNTHLSPLQEAIINHRKPIAFVGTDLTETNFRYANLKKAIFPSAKLEGSDFSHADLTEANFGKSYCSTVKFDFANLYKTDLSSVNSLSIAQLSKARLCQTKLPGYLLCEGISGDRDCEPDEENSRASRLSEQSVRVNFD
ncbi:MAG: pentapeptide repeat-containing protein [Cyanobacteria bacterium P01_H01_bin.21]